MKEALKELKKIIQMPDQKHWNCFELRERALEEWIDRWIIDISKEQLLINNKNIPSDFEDMLKEQLFASILDQVMEDAAIINKTKNKIEGKLLCLRRKPKNQ